MNDPSVLRFLKIKSFLKKVLIDLLNINKWLMFLFEVKICCAKIQKIIAFIWYFAAALINKKVFYSSSQNNLT